MLIDKLAGLFPSFMSIRVSPYRSGIEIHNLYDALEYAGQVEEAAKSHRKEMKRKKEQGEAPADEDRKTPNAGEFLSGFWAEDRLIPSITVAMDGFHGAVCGSGQDDKVLTVIIVPAASCHKQGFPVFLSESVFGFLPVPLIEGCCGHYSAPAADTLAEEGLFGGRLASCIEYQSLFQPRCHGEAPPLPGTGYPAVICQQDRGFVRGADIGAADSVQDRDRILAERFFRLSYQFFDFFCCLVQRRSEDVGVPLMHEKRTGHVRLMTKEDMLYCIETGVWGQ